MKKYVLFVIMSLVFLSCANDETVIQKMEDSAHLSSSTMDSFTNSFIGINKNGAFKLRVAENSVLTAVKEFSREFDLGLEPQSFQIETIGKEKYLRILNKNNTVSTVALLLDDSNNYITGKTICTSSICSSGGGCIPNGSYCTECKYGQNGELRGDCKRTTSDDDPSLDP